MAHALSPLGRRMSRAFASYRAAIDQARDPDEPVEARRLARARAANGRARLERMFATVGETA